MYSRRLSLLFAVHVTDTNSSAAQMVWMFTMYRQDNNDQEFMFLHILTRIEKCEKWTGRLGARGRRVGGEAG